MGAGVCILPAGNRESLMSLMGEVWFDLALHKRGQGLIQWSKIFLAECLLSKRKGLWLVSSMT